MNKDLMLDIGKTIGIPFVKSIIIPEAKKAGKNAIKKTAKKSILPTVSIMTGAVAGYVLYQKELKK